MSIEKKNFDDVKLARPVSVVDLWDIDDRVDRLEDITYRLEKVTEALIELYSQERVKSWELILKEMLRKELEKRGDCNGRNRRCKT